MPERKKSEGRKPESGHTPVSNVPEEEDDFFIEGRATQPPFLGKDSKTNKVAAGGVEEVGRRRPEAAMAVRAMAPTEPRVLSEPISRDLRDIGEASFGPQPSKAIREILLGEDNRVRIKNTTDYPWRAIASLLITAADNSRWIGTGWFIGPHTLITAGHCVCIKDSGVPGRDGWVKETVVMPGRDGKIIPFGPVTSRSFRSVKGWTERGDENYDYGAIIIPTDLGNDTGWFGFSVYPDADLRAGKGNLSGYPGDKRDEEEGTQWFDTRNITGVNNRKVFYDIDTVGGQSGSAVFQIVNDERVAIAIHAYGGATANSGTRISTPVYNNLVEWNK